MWFSIVSHSSDKHSLALLLVEYISSDTGQRLIVRVVCTWKNANWKEKQEIIENTVFVKSFAKHPVFAGVETDLLFKMLLCYYIFLLYHFCLHILYVKSLSNDFWLFYVPLSYLYGVCSVKHTLGLF